MPKRSWRAHVGRRKEGGVEVGIEITTEAEKTSTIPGKVVGKTPESIFRGVKSLPREMHPFGISLARVVLSDLELRMSPGQTNIDDGLEMQLQGPHILDAIDKLKEGGITSKQAAKYVFNQLRNAGAEADEDVVFLQVQTRYGEIKKED